MKRPFEYSFTRYLSSKKSVDDRALNQHVFQTLRKEIGSDSRRKTLEALEIGAGIGTMIERMRNWGLFDSSAGITAIDHDAENIQAARERLSGSVTRLELETIDIFDFVEREGGHRQWDLLIAHAFLDLVDSRKLLPLLCGLLKPTGLAYFTINFDGATLLEPSIDPALDALIEGLYHRTMDERTVAGERSGDSQTGRHLFERLAGAGYDVLAAGSSDWVVHPRQGAYVDDEAYFLHFIIHTIHHALRDLLELEKPVLAHWVEQRHRQIENGQLVYIAHQIDFLATPAR